MRELYHHGAKKVFRDTLEELLSLPDKSGEQGALYG